MLKHQAEPVATHFRPGSIAQFGNLCIGQPDLAVIGRIEPCDQVQERALAAAGFAGERDALAGSDREIYPRSTATFRRPCGSSWSDRHMKHVWDCRWSCATMDRSDHEIPLT